MQKSPTEIPPDLSVRGGAADMELQRAMVLTARVVCREPPLTLASGAQIWATDWFLYKKKGSEALFVPHLAYFGYLIVISLIT